MSFIRRGHSSKVMVVSSLAVLALFVMGLGTAGGAGDFTLTADNNFDGNVRLTWTWVDDPQVDHYNIYWDTEEFDSVEGKQIKSAERGNTFMVLDLENGVEHYFAVTAVNSTGAIIAEDFADAVPKLPHLKEVKFWNLMAVFLLTTAIFAFVIIKIPTWTKSESGGM